MKFFICPICKNVVELVENRGVPISCCGRNMQYLEPNTEEASEEKHLPFVTFENNVLNVIIGEVLHPSSEAHYIGFITVKAGDLIIRKELSKTEEPKATFLLGDYKGNVDVYAWCNLHGSWQTTITI